MVVPGVIKRLVRGGAEVDILLESGEMAFVPLSEIPAKAMPKVRELMEKGTLQEVCIVQLDRASGTATCSLKGLIAGLPEEPKKNEGRRRPVPPPPAPPPPPKPVRPVPAGPPKASASERARRQQEEILRRMRGQ
jgi:predicted RNA-binding protein with RPS1 domain